MIESSPILTAVAALTNVGLEVCGPIARTLCVGPWGTQTSSWVGKQLTRKIVSVFFRGTGQQWNLAAVSRLLKTSVPPSLSHLDRLEVWRGRTSESRTVVRCGRPARLVRAPAEWTRRSRSSPVADQRARRVFRRRTYTRATYRRWSCWRRRREGRYLWSATRTDWTECRRTMPLSARSRCQLLWTRKKANEFRDLGVCGMRIPTYFQRLWSYDLMALYKSVYYYYYYYSLYRPTFV